MHITQRHFRSPHCRHMSGRLMGRALALCFQGRDSWPFTRAAVDVEGMPADLW